MLEKAIGDLLRENGMTLSVAESCTGGLVSNRITNVSGSSDYFEGGIVTYSNKAKAQHLGIPLKYIERYGAVSSQVAKKMAEGVRQAFHTTYGLSTTGVAGPTGGTKKTPVGTVFIGISDGQKTFTKKGNLKDTRREIKEKAAQLSLRFLYQELVRSIQNSTSSIQHQASSIQDRVLRRLSLSEESEIVLIRKAPKGISSRTGRLGIFPASFNPPTLAHLALTRGAKKQGNFDEVLILLDIQAMDKEPKEAKFEERLTMLKKVFGRDPKISIGLSNRGLFLEKLKPLRKHYPSPVEFFFIVGFDTILRIIEKKYYRNRKQCLDALFSQCQFLVANRGQYQERALEIFFHKREIKTYKKRVSFIPLPSKYSSLSSSLIRERISQGQPVDEWVPASIHRFIKKKGLYSPSSS
ncbi:MAG: hypothetical protein A2156_00780 [Deltaproteobacteria bacterium RBG_16_48_10]|nr:MAG: hypothetical protein A2156_00780 [Deltaproteobacteria bacterium RBG_16_48_10]